MAERFEMSFKNPELKMWFIIMGPVTVLGMVFLFTSSPSNRYYPLGILLIGLLSYYIWRYRYRKKKKETKEQQ